MSYMVQMLRIVSFDMGKDGLIDEAVEEELYKNICGDIGRLLSLYEVVDFSAQDTMTVEESNFQIIHDKKVAQNPKVQVDNQELPRTSGEGILLEYTCDSCSAPYKTKNPEQVLCDRCLIRLFRDDEIVDESDYDFDMETWLRGDDDE